MSSKRKTKVYDVGLFRRLMQYIKPYKMVFTMTLLFVTGLAIFGAVRPYVLQQAIDNQIELRKYDGFLFYIVIMIALLVMEVVCQLLFIYYASWLGQSVVKDIRVKLFKHIMNFKMKYFDNSSVGVLITRTVT